MARKKYSNPSVESAISRTERLWDDAFGQLEKYLLREAGKLNRKGGILMKDRFNIQTINDEILPSLLVRAREAGFGDVMREHARRCIDLTKDVLAESGRLGLPETLSATTGESAKALITETRGFVADRERGIARDIEMILRRSVTGNVKWDDLVKSISSTMGTRMNQARVETANVLSRFHNDIRVQHFENRGPDGEIRGTGWFLYDGPRDVRNRDFCAAFVGTRVTIEILDAHAVRLGRGNRPGPMPWYECRHELVPLVDKEDIERYQIGPRG